MDAIGKLNFLDAVRVPTDPYSLCWCGSGKKWKFCHKLRESQTKIPGWEIDKRRAEFFQSGTCLHPAASELTCSSPEAIRSHTVQRGGALRFVAENGHVYSAKKGFRNISKNEGQVDMELEGTKAASTFPGYCNQHDTALFRPAELSDAALDETSGFLLSLRAISYELVAKQGQLKAVGIYQEVMDAGVDFETQVFIQNYLAVHRSGVERGFDNISKAKSQYDDAYLNSNLNDFCLYGITFDEPLPFVAAGAFIPEHDFLGGTINHLLIADYKSIIAINVTQLGGRTCAVFGWFDSPDSTPSRFVDSFRKLSPDTKPSALLLMCLEYMENVYFTPSWWDGLRLEEREHLNARIKGGMPGEVRSSTAMMVHGSRFFDSKILSEYEKP